MTLTEVTEKLFETTEKLNEVLPKYTDAEAIYNRKYYDLYLNSNRGTEKAREAEAKAILIEEGDYERYASLKLDMKILYNRKDLYIEVSKNLRSMENMRT